MRIFMSETAAAGLGGEVARVLGALPHHIVTPGTAAAADFEVAFLSRDVTGRSTKMQLEPGTLAFHDAMRGAKSLRWVQMHSAGADRPIYPELQSRGVTVCTGSGANAAVVAQSALAGLLALARKLPTLWEQQQRREWKSLLHAPPRDLAGQVATIVGWGPIGQHLAAWLAALGLEIRVVRNSDAAAGGHPTFPYERIVDAARGADWLAIACPLSDRTRRLVGAEVMAALGPGARILNVGRGEVVDEAVMIEALRECRLGGAYLDVFEQEPLPPSSPLWSLPDVIVTPHTAGSSDGNEKRVAAMFLDNLARHVRGEPLLRVARAG
jgi:phosphoglycerate dehydrogenase-like enzyme